MAKRKCKACDRMVEEPYELCLIHAVDGSFVERVRGAMALIREEDEARRKVAKASKPDYGRDSVYQEEAEEPIDPDGPDEPEDEEDE